MARLKSKKVIKIIIIVAIAFMVASIFVNGINLVPFIYRNEPVSFITPDITWNSKPSDVILKYGYPLSISEVNDITGERTFDFSFVYEGKDVAFSADNRGTVNSQLHRYSFIIDCKTPEDANKFFNEAHKSIMDLHKDDPDFKFDGTLTETDYEFTDSNAASYSSTNENGVIKTTIIDDDGNEIPIEEVDDIVEIKTKVNRYDMSNTVGVSLQLSYSEGESCVYLHSDIMY